MVARTGSRHHGALPAEAGYPSFPPIIQPKTPPEFRERLSGSVKRIRVRVAGELSVEVLVGGGHVA